MSQAPPTDVTRTSPEAEISLGRELRRAREVRGISIEQIARETKINERYLHALENDRLDLLPGQLYARNFVRSVARSIGADEEELLDYFNYQVRLRDDIEGVRPDGRAAHGSRRGVLLAVLAAAAVLVVALLTFALRDEDKGTTAPAPTRAARTPVLPAAVPAPSTTDGPGLAVETTPGGAAATGVGPVPPVLAPSRPVAPPAATGAVAPAPILAAGASGPAAAAGPAPTLRVAFEDRSWVEVQREGDELPDVGMKNKGETMTIALDRPVTLTIANSAGASLSVDGQPFRALGAPQEKRTITVDRKNYTQYLKR